MKLLKLSLFSLLLSMLFISKGVADCSYELFSISSAKNNKIVDFIDQLSDECEFSIIITDEYAKKVINNKLNKLHLKNLTINEVLDIVLKENNLSYTLQNNILKISYLITKHFSIDYILSQRKGSGSTDITLSSSSATNSATSSSSSSTSKRSSNNNTSSSNTNGGRKSNGTESGMKISTSDEVRFWQNLDLELGHILNRPEDIYIANKPIINKNAGIITVTATQKQIQRLQNYLQELQDKVQLQVLIDVQLLTVTMSASKSTGVDWQQLYALQNVTLELDSQSGTAPSTTLLTVNAGGSLNQVIKFLHTQGDVNSISNPKVLTLNNQPALITVGTEFFYKIKSTGTQATVGGTNTNENELIQSVFAGVLLDITPEISNNGEITLKINPSLSETTNDMTLDLGIDRQMPPDLNRRQLSSVVTIKDGSRIILGGLINTKNTKTSNKVPILGDIPGLSYFFKYEERIKYVEELIIIIEPHIIDKANNNLSLSDLGYEGITDSVLHQKKDTLEVIEKLEASENSLLSDTNSSQEEEDEDVDNDEITVEEIVEVEE